MPKTYYRLAKNALLCGFKGLPFGLYDEYKDQTHFFNREEYAFVLRCAGTELIEEEVLTEKEKTVLNGLKEKKLVEAKDEPMPLEPYQEYIKYENIYKLTAHWSVTGKCNYRCRHCFMSCPDYKESDLSFDQCRDVIRQLAECGIRSVSLTGGEPLIRSDFLDIMRECRDNGIRVSGILTNGALVSRELLDGIAALGMYPSFQMSFDGVGWHDWIRGIDGAEEKVIKAFRLLKEYGIPVTSAMCLHKHNIHTIRESVNLLAELGCSSLKINVANPSGLWANQPEHFITQEEGYQAFLDYIPQYLEDRMPMDIMLEDVFMFDKIEGRAFILADKEAEEGARYVCMPLRTGFYVGPKGEILPCQSFIAKDIAARYPNLFDMPLKKILSDSNYTVDTLSKLSDLMAANKECRECKWSKVCCGGCRANAIGDHDMNYHTTNKNMCRLFNDGWFDKFSETIRQFNAAVKKLEPEKQA